MVINTVGVEVSENVYVNKAGKFLFKIEKWEEDGFTQYGDSKFKMFFKGVEVGTKDPIYLHSEMFNVGQKSLWRIKQLEVALKSPEIFELSDWIGRYVNCEIVERTYNKNDGTEGKSYNVVNWSYSQLNDKLPPIPEKKQNKNNGSEQSEALAEDDEIPF